MSALLDPEPQSAERHMRTRWLAAIDFDAGLATSPPPAREPIYYSPDSREIPFPEAARPYLRADAAGPAAHWALLLAGLMDELRTLRASSPRVGQLRELFRFLERPGALVSAEAFERVATFCPPVPCPQCGARHFRYAERIKYCSDRCRRDAQIPAYDRARRAIRREEARLRREERAAQRCARPGCDRPLARAQRTYCSLGCSRAAYREKVQADFAARRAVAS